MSTCSSVEPFASALSLDGTLHGKDPADLGLRRIEVVRFEDAPGNEPRCTSSLWTVLAS